jgi:hypothetical protein
MIPPRTRKRCPNCRKWLPFEAFSANRRVKSGRSSWCLECARSATRRWRAENRDGLNERRRAEYRAANPLPTRPCTVCGRPFSGRPDALVCSKKCRRLRKLEQRRRLRYAADP